jgi:hypothetical protein
VGREQTPHVPLTSQSPVSELGRQCDVIEISGTRDRRKRCLGGPKLITRVQGSGDPARQTRWRGFPLGRSSGRPLF